MTVEFPRVASDTVPAAEAPSSRIVQLPPKNRDPAVHLAMPGTSYVEYELPGCPFMAKARILQAPQFPL